MPPLRMRVSRTQTQKRSRKATVHGGVKTPPYKPGETSNDSVNPVWGTPLPGGIYASPTNTRYRVHNPKNVIIRQTSAAGP